MINRSKAPEICTLKRISFSMPEPLRLGSGTRVHLLEEGSDEVVRVEWVFWKGSWDQQKKLQAYTCLKMLPQGAAGLSQKDIAEMLQYHGAYLDEKTNHHSSSLILYSLTKHLPDLLPLMHKLITRPDFPEAEFNVQVNEALQDFRIESEKVISIARRNFNAMLFGEEHPYGSMLSEDDFHAIMLADSLKYYRDNLVAGNCDIIVAGRPHEALLSDIERLFGVQSANEANSLSPSYVEMAAPETRKEYLTKQGALQAAIRIGKRLVNRTHPDYHRLNILNTMLGGYFGSRLMSNLREDKGYTYGVGSGLVSMLHGGLFFISGQVAARHWEDAVAEIRKELALLCSEPASESELSLVKNYLRGSVARAFDGPFAKAEKIRSYLEYGLDGKDLDKFFEALDSTGPNDLMELSNRYLHPDTMTELVVGP